MVSGVYVGCAVCAVSAALRSWVLFCCECLSYTCSGGAGCLVAIFCTLLLLLWVELPWGLCCGVLSPWPLVAPYPSVVSSLGFFLWRLFRLGFEGCDPGFGSSLLLGGSLSLVLVVFAWFFNSFVVQVPWVSLDFLLSFFHLAFQCLLVVRGG